ncbi:glutamyl-tRNA(Gln) amidotransferase subunit C [Pseudoclavibacter endophyticus]|uniref:Aspartyl/glutamyl-tRNA(Asn/Gln) amidotransferase subunit C n=1 Tax=Pseudoclavibacter endophyticus TaxID=1778590 RepID=A0A6H9WEX8_9MICO|nr:Asp-tRNA(Asn)/Glu-tRNA(Gln) amidotransferase subunit GatC [Pseudoclavibacter endophyticus]KAB1646668.1 Asp-tRNA(Asn)/Glu-tRNA(Gln) amidotransferase subunit GatC [Pseudoclavibacter endophyticus]GGA76647.1 glutamyl-tRNA(Gln) amidotransferase subunit C [Pseudoclavibacter endophyticus]
MADITAAEVEHLAELARIDLTPAEVDDMTTQLVEIQHLIARVQQVATPSVPTTSHPVVMHNVMRPDVAEPPLDREAALAGAPDSDGGQFRVTSILGEEQ